MELYIQAPMHFCDVMLNCLIIGKEVNHQLQLYVCVCFIATLESLQHVSAYMGHLQVIFYKYWNT
jgi:hypothetical protein